MSDVLSLGERSLKLQRLPLRKNETLRAWDAADEYLLSHVQDELERAGSPLIINDAFGALTLVLADRVPRLVTDSEIARRALAHNATENGIDLDGVQVFDPLEPWGTPPAFVLMKVPKNHELLRHQLYRLRDLLTGPVPIIAAGMAKYIHTSTLKIFEAVIGPTRTSLARKKARLIFADFVPELRVKPAPEPMRHSVTELGLELVDYPNVFSQGRLDRGTRLLLKHLPEAQGDCVDLGCGNGALGIRLALSNPEARVTFIDESHLAVASARASWAANGLPTERARFLPGDGLTDEASNSADLILCNPPFHQGQVVGDQVAWQMFTQARNVLRPGGTLLVVGNRHLGYHVKLARLFGDVATVGSDAKFVVLAARKPGSSHADR